MCKVSIIKKILMGPYFEEQRYKKGLTQIILMLYQSYENQTCNNTISPLLHAKISQFKGMPRAKSLLAAQVLQRACVTHPNLSQRQFHIPNAGVSQSQNAVMLQAIRSQL